MGQCACFGGGGAERERRAEAELAESKEARAKAAEAAQRRQEEFDRSAAGRAAKAQMKAMKEAKTSSNQGEPVLKVNGRWDRKFFVGVDPASLAFIAYTKKRLIMVDKSLTALDFREDSAESFSDV
ncbi:hypothetical protein OsJ_36250 [Oryza sativa Japonica Group]|uniref:Uncharacterized protein n=1 Tax=Oryza sativa subsp. japonica TaxID=39947 RepID=B9GDD4_ORYSJ|nr:hypothetical protein OsJ_36250 [Oryza sativa Japonica Group]